MSGSTKGNTARISSQDERTLRQRAEERLPRDWADDLAARSSDEMRQVLHDLIVHQIELEIQNEDMRQVQDQLLAAQERYFDLYDLAPVGYLTLNQHSIILEANLTAARQLQTTRSCLSRQPFTNFVFPDDQGVYYRFRSALAESGEMQKCRLRLKRADNSAFWGQLDTVIAFDEKDGLPIYRVTMTDISEVKQAEETQRQLQLQLAEAQKMELVGRLAGGIAHEFNNQLAVILLRTEMSLGFIDLDTVLHRNLTAIFTTAQRSAELVRQLLGFARKQVITPIALDLNAAVETLLPTLRRLVSEEVELIWQPAASLWPVRLDPTQVEEVLVNLCLNARDAISRAGAIVVQTEKITIRQTMVDDSLAIPPPGDYVRLTFSDTGSGIEKEVLDHIFEPFYTTKEVGKGTGLGLAMVEGIVRQNRGYIQVSSRPSHGATFHIWLPRQHDSLAAPEVTEALPLLLGHGETILLVDDDVDLLNIETEVLEHLGYTVIAAATPDDALRYMEERSERVDLLITDVVMPEMNGRVLAERITSANPGVKLLYLSGYSSTYISSRGLLTAEAHFLDKPYSLSALAVKVREVLDAKI